MNKSAIFSPIERIRILFYAPSPQKAITFPNIMNCFTLIMGMKHVFMSQRNNLYYASDECSASRFQVRNLVLLNILQRLKKENWPFLSAGL
jgi:hypothetical protein